MPVPEPPLSLVPVIAHAGQPVITTELLAQEYGCSVDQIHDNYRQNRDRFAEGVHFFKLIGADLKAIKNQPVLNRLVAPRASHLVVWTERGAVRHAKLISTDAAWAAFGRLEDTYFDAVQPEAPKPMAQVVRDTAAAFKAYFSIARLTGLDRNQAAFAANRAARRATGVAPLDEIGVTHLEAPRQERIMTPSDIGAANGGISARSVNLMLIEHGFQTETRDANDRLIKVPTEKGEPYAVWQDTPKQHNDGTPIRQLKWSEGVIAALRASMNNRMQ